jgi:3-deoxy-D-manno-octulosonic-acid transferase
MACRVHLALEKDLPGLLTIIVPRHPERRSQIIALQDQYGISIKFRGAEHRPPTSGDRIYIADTLGELGLFYRLAPVACIGRSFSDDGGGGHNPIEAAQQDCAILHGPHVQNLARIYEEFDNAGAATGVLTEEDLSGTLGRLLGDRKALQSAQEKAAAFARQKAQVIDTILSALAPFLSRMADDTKAERRCG